MHCALAADAVVNDVERYDDVRVVVYKDAGDDDVVDDDQ